MGCSLLDELVRINIPSKVGMPQTRDAVVTDGFRLCAKCHVLQPIAEYYMRQDAYGRKRYSSTSCKECERKRRGQHK